MFPRTSQRFSAHLFIKPNTYKCNLRRYAATSPKISPRSVDPGHEVPTPENVRRLRAKEHRWRRSLLGGIFAATVIGYYLDGKYNARAIRRTLRTAWVGALLAADYKLNFTYCHRD